MAFERLIEPEVRLVLCCARTHLDDAARFQASELLNNELKWDRVLHLALNHRVAMLLNNSFSKLPPDTVPEAVRKFLDHYSKARTTANVAKTQALLEAVTALSRHGISAVTYKGPVLTLLAYGSLALREFSDVDLLVKSHDAEGAREVLRTLGYNEVSKRLNWETEFRRGEASIDLHWRIAPAHMFDYWIGFDFDLQGAWARLESIALFEHEVPCFGPEDALLAQCQSSLKNGFNRSLAQLRWVCDIAELVRAQRNLSWDIVMERAAAVKSRRALLLCLDLAHSILCADLPDDIVEAIRKDPIANHLRLQLTRPYFSPKQWQPLSQSRQFLYAALLKEDFRERLPYLRRCISTLIQPTEKDEGIIRLPPALHWLYYLIRPVRLGMASLGSAWKTLRHAMIQ